MNRSCCDTCAFRKGKLGAAQEPHNVLRGLICSLGPLPFACHHTRDGREYDWRDPTGLAFVLLPKQDRRMCTGWQRAVARRTRLGYFRGPYRIIRRAVAQMALELVDAFLDRRATPAVKERTRKKLWQQIRFLCKRNLGPLRIPL